LSLPCIKIKSQIFTLLFLIINNTVGFGQEDAKNSILQEKHALSEKRHFLSINPIKPFIGLPNIHYEYQARKNIGITAFSEVLALEVIKDFEHPDMVSTLGISFYPFLGEKEINQGLFLNINTSYILYFRESEKINSFANGVQIGFKHLFKNIFFIEPKLLINYVYQEKSVLPGFEVLIGFRF